MRLVKINWKTEKGRTTAVTARDE